MKAAILRLLLCTLSPVVLASCSSGSSGDSGSDAGGSPSDAGGSACALAQGYSFRLKQSADSGYTCKADYSAGIDFGPEGGLYLSSGGGDLTCTITQATYDCPAHVHAACVDDTFQDASCGNGPCGGSLDLYLEAVDGGSQLSEVVVMDTTPYGTCQFTTVGAQ